MNETTATHDVHPFAEVIIQDVDISSREIPTGWLCPRCGAVNAPDVKRCGCEPGLGDLRRGVLPNTVAGPSEVK